MQWNEIKALARDLRKNQTAEESQLWSNLRNRKMKGVKFFRQHPIKYEQHGKQHFFIADFFSTEASLAIEVDGKIHETQKDYDKQRDIIINNKGIKVLRFTNEEIDQNLNKVLNQIEKVI